MIGMAAEPTDRYGLTSRVIHWTTAVLVLANPILAWTMEATESRTVFLAHASLGASVLALTLVRLVWRLTHRWPSLPQGMRDWERSLARLTHVLFYPLLLLIPVLGLAAASAGIPGNDPIPLFGIIPLPQLPVSETEASDRYWGGLHQLGVLALLAVLALHVAGAVKHTYVQRHGVLQRMAPGVGPTPEPRQAAPSPR